MVLGEDPYVGFQATLPLFVPVADRHGQRWLETAPGKLGFFNRQRFRATKAPGTQRIFCLGGSTTYGRPYDHTTSFCGWIDALLTRLYPDRRFELINAGGISYASYRLTRLMRELNRYQPDHYLVYTGHNEFLEARTYGELRYIPAWIATADTLLGRFASYNTLRRLIKRPSHNDDRALVKPEVDEILAHSVGPEDYRRDDQQRARTLEHFRFNLQHMTDLAQQVDAEITYVVPASNYRDFEPFKSEHSPGLDAQAVERWQRRFNDGPASEGAADLVAVATSRSATAQLNPRHAGGQYALGRALSALGRERQAYQAFQRAIDEDVAPLRAPGDFVRAVRELAPRRRVIDFPALIEKTSAIPGNDWFLDHVHPTVDGHLQLALAVLNAWTDTGVLPDRPGDWRDIADDVQRLVLATIDTEMQARALRNLAQVLGWAGKLDSAHRLLLKARALIGERPEIMNLLGQSLLRLQRPREAAEIFHQLIEASPQAETYLLAASAHTEAREPGRAIAALLAGMERFPDASQLHLGVSEQLLQNGGIADAGHYRQRAETLVRRQLGESPQNQSLRLSLARLLEARRAWSEAREQYLLLAGQAPEHAAYSARLGHVTRQLGLASESEQWFLQALALDPARDRVYDQLAALYLDRGQTGKALATYQRLLARDSHHALALFNRGILLHQLQRSSEALASLRSALAASPEDPNTLYALAVVHTELGNTGDAISAYRRLLEIDAAHADAHNNLGGLLAADGHAVEALNHFRRALLHDPGHRGARRNLQIFNRRHPALVEAEDE